MDEFEELRKALQPETPVQQVPPPPPVDVPLPPGNPKPWKFWALLAVAGCFVFFAVIGNLSDNRPASKGSKPDPRPARQETPAPVAAKPAVAEPSMGKWTSYGTSSEFDDSTGASASLAAENEIEGWPNQTTRPRLALRCQEGTTDLILFTGITAEPEYGNYGGATLRIRLDDGKAFDRNATQSTDRKAYFVASPIGLAKQIEKSSQVLIGFVPFNSSQQSIYFRTRGAREAFKNVRQQCKW